MKLVLSIGCMVMLCVSAVVADDDKKSEKFDAKKILGEWEYEAGTKAGAESDEQMLQGTVKITKETFTLPGGPDQEFVMAYKLDASKSPATIDFEIKSGPVPEGKAVGIIKLHDGKIHLCYNPMGTERPEKFESTEDNGMFMLVLKKKED